MPPKYRLHLHLLPPCLLHWSTVLLHERTGFQLVKKTPHILWNPKVHYRIHKCRHLSLSWASSIQSIPTHSISWRSILILSSRPHTGLPIVLFPSCFPNKTLYTPLLSTICVTFLAHHILLYFITRTIWGEQHISLGPHYVVLFHSPVTSFLLGPNILLNTLFSNTLSLLSLLKMSDPFPSTANINFQNLSLLNTWLPVRRADNRSTFMCRLSTNPASPDLLSWPVHA